MIHSDDFTIVIPAPPFSTAVEKNVGIQVNNPQYAKSTLVAMRDTVIVFRAIGRLNISASERIEVLSDVRSRDIQREGSGICRRIHRVNNAGRTPTTNRILHPYVGRMAADKIAARM